MELFEKSGLKELIGEEHFFPDEESANSFVHQVQVKPATDLSSLQLVED